MLYLEGLWNSVTINKERTYSLLLTTCFTYLAVNQQFHFALHYGHKITIQTYIMLISHKVYVNVYFCRRSCGDLVEL